MATGAEQAWRPRAQLIVLEDKAEYVARSSPERVATMQRVPFPALAICNPSLRAVGSEGARFFEGCLSIPGYQVCSNCCQESCPFLSALLLQGCLSKLGYQACGGSALPFCR